MSEGPKPRRFALALELTLCAVLVTILSVNALRRMDYLASDTADHIRMTDVSRTAYVAKNIAEGRGYTTNDLPANLIDFYDQRGKLHDEHWVNADRFPFAAYATAALFTITRSTSWEVGILVYNLIFFIAFFVLLYKTTTAIWKDRYAGLFAVTLALLHPYTFQFLYWKDGDMLVLTIACMALLYRFYEQPSGTISRKFAVGLGTMLAWVFLARPNLGVAFILFVGVSIVARLWASRRTEGSLGAAFKRHLQRELLIPVTVIVWCIPFMIHSMSEWGQPLFSANNLYQLPLGTRFGMGTDTWWKYTEPGETVTLGKLISEDAGMLLSKFTSSWIATIKHVFASYPIEIALACGLFFWLGRASADPAERAKNRPIRMIGFVILFAVVMNLLLLPLYSYQDYSFRHYLAFGLPVLWFAGGRAIAETLRYLEPAAVRARDHVKAQALWYVAGLVVAIVVWNIGAATPADANRLFGRTATFVGNHWLAPLLVLIAIAARRPIMKLSPILRVGLAMFLLVFACYRPNVYMKRANFSFLPLNDHVWDTMRQRTGLVSSFALQSEVAWHTGRKNIPAPEWPMHIYSFLLDHKLEVEDLYIESAEALTSPLDGPFALAAPGFEGYVRLQQYQVMPGYDLAFHEEAVRGYPKFKVKPRRKASTVFRLANRDAVTALLRSPDRIDLGDKHNVIYTPHGWDRYVTLDGKTAVSATSITRDRYEGTTDAPYEDASITFFLDQRHPKSVDLEFYAPHATTFQFYWNLDLYAYDHPRDRKAHLVGSITTTTAGWQKVHLDVPAALLRKGLNKLGLRTAEFHAVSYCPESMTDAACLSLTAPTGKDADEYGVPVVLHPAGLTSAEFAVVALFASSLAFNY